MEGIFELLRAQADPNMEINGQTPIQMAAKMNQVETIKVMQKYGGDIHKVNAFGNALHFSCADDQVETTLYLLKEGV